MLNVSKVIPETDYPDVVKFIQDPSNYTRMVFREVYDLADSLIEKYDDPNNLPELQKIMEELLHSAKFDVVEMFVFMRQITNAGCMFSWHPFSTELKDGYNELSEIVRTIRASC